MILYKVKGHVSEYNLLQYQLSKMTACVDRIVGEYLQYFI